MQTPKQVKNLLPYEDEHKLQFSPNAALQAMTAAGMQTPAVTVQKNTAEILAFQYFVPQISTVPNIEPAAA